MTNGKSCSLEIWHAVLYCHKKGVACEYSSQNIFLDMRGRKEGIENTVLAAAIREIEEGLFDAALGGGLVKKRVAREGSGKSSGYRTIIAFSSGQRSLFLYGFAKNDRNDIGNDELRELRKLSQLFLGLTDDEITSALVIDRIEEIPYND